MDEPAFNVGDEVKIVGGTFDGFGGTIVTAEVATALPNAVVPDGVDDRTGFWVAIDIFGRKVPVMQLPKQLRLA